METNPYQNSLNLPKTAFPMKANLSQKEPVQIQNWEKNNVYDLIQKKNADAVEFVMPDGPPYANGNIHIGHCLNKLLKDFAIKYQAMQGRSAPFIPGWDCHGLPIEHAVNKELGPKRKEKSEGELRSLCRSYAEKFVGLQRDQFKRLGILADWDHPYKTMDSSYEASMIRALGKIYDQGFVYRGEKPVHWCWSCGTALAEAEVEYENRKDPSIFVKFEIKDGLDVLGQPKGKTFVLIWTTTPWSLPANLAVCVHPDFDYGLYKVTSSSLDAEENW
jgi:isoleucyl-tRNA synthetase